MFPDSRAGEGDKAEVWSHVDNLANSLIVELQRLESHIFYGAKLQKRKNESESLSLCRAIAVAMVIASLPRCPEQHREAFDVVTMKKALIHIQFAIPPVC